MLTTTVELLGVLSRGVAPYRNRLMNPANERAIVEAAHVGAWTFFREEPPAMFSFEARRDGRAVLWIASRKLKQWLADRNIELEPVKRVGDELEPLAEGDSEIMTAGWMIRGDAC